MRRQHLSSRRVINEPIVNICLANNECGAHYFLQNVKVHPSMSGGELYFVVDG
jgi:hypothetical protein